jgi:chemotaxis protein CheZ
MSVSAASREFSVERRARVRQREKEFLRLVNRTQREGVEVSVAMDPTGISNADLMEEIEALRGEMRDLQLPRERAVEGERESVLERAARLEIGLMVHAIARAKEELASIQHPLAENSKVEAASNELDEIVRATEHATNQILEANEKIEREVHKLASTHHNDEEVVLATDHVACEVIKILEASNFQDITGQRVTKVVRTLRFIESRILAMIDIWGIEAFADLPIEDDFANGAEKLMNGPQIGNAGITQADVDALFD